MKTGVVRMIEVAEQQAARTAGGPRIPVSDGHPVLAESSADPVLTGGLDVRSGQIVHAAVTGALAVAA